MKVKCRGFEGNLISINPMEEYIHREDKVLRIIVLYKIVVKIGVNERITISNVEDEEIEFIK